MDTDILKPDKKASFSKFKLAGLALVILFFILFIYFYLYNYIGPIIFFTILLSLFSYYKSVHNNSALPPAGKLRSYYIIALIVYIMVVTLLYHYDPWGIMSSYVEMSVISFLCFGIFITLMIYWYNYIFKEKRSQTYNNINDGYKIVFFCLFSLAGIGISIAVIQLLLSGIGSASSSSDIVRYTLNIFIIVVILAIVYKFLTAENYFENIPVVSLIINLIFYIPCLFSGLLDLFISKDKDKDKNKDDKGKNKDDKGKNRSIDTTYLPLVIILVILMVLYFLLPYINNFFVLKGGKLLVNQPVYIDQLNTVSDYQKLNDTDKFDYRYGLSFWIYIDERPPSTNYSYDTYTSVMNYGDKPNILYKASTNTLMITEKYESPPTSTTTTTTTSNKELDSNGNRIIYKKGDILLQKWNNIILNYVGGTLDVFYNGELVKSAIEVVPYMTLDNLTIGSDGGINGAICNMIYYSTPLDITKINYLYESVKGKTPPVMYSSTKGIIPQE